MNDNSTETHNAPQEIDVRLIPRGERHPQIFALYESLAVDQSLLLINDHEPRHLREEFDLELTRSFEWEALTGSSDHNGWRIQITKKARTALPRVVGDTSEPVYATAAAEPSGSVWRLPVAQRDLDSNIISLPAGDEISEHTGPDLDVLIIILAGHGTLETERGSIVLDQGKIVWLPKQSQRRFSAGPRGLRYLTVHNRKPTLTITPKPA